MPRRCNVMRFLNACSFVVKTYEWIHRIICKVKHVIWRIKYREFYDIQIISHNLFSFLIGSIHVVETTYLDQHPLYVRHFIHYISISKDNTGFVWATMILHVRVSVKILEYLLLNKVFEICVTRHLHKRFVLQERFISWPL